MYPKYSLMGLKMGVSKVKLHYPFLLLLVVAHNFYFCLIYSLPDILSGALKVLPEVQLNAEWGGSITIKCPLPQIHTRMYLCRQMTDPQICTTVVSSSFVKKDYKARVTLTPWLNKKLFLVEMTQLTESDNGVYACGVGTNTDLGKTQKIILNVHDVTTSAPRTEAPVHQPSSTIPATHYPRVPRTSSVTAAKSPTLLPTTTASKTSAQQALGPLGASYSHHTKLHGQRTLHHSPQYEREDQGLHIPVLEFHILIPTFLGFLLLVLLGLVVKRAILRRKAFSRRMGRVAMRIRGQEASSRFPAQRRGALQRPRSQNNVYSACPRRAPLPDREGSAEASLLSAPASAPPDPSQVLEAPWCHTPPLKTSCEYVTLCHQPAVNVEDTGSDDYINIPGPRHLPSCPPGHRPSCQ
ncbi:fas apoptotic inhibitory molecule 3-like protein [Cricetulus griseus]|uniref:Fas apoptotic inhibitory molecule 3-like protein n=1 Tax=Cricetulus griseus TaxID=10029 RepID=A0A061I3F4_CRIGR|nr:fas apoptotic inhibitory molecule 3-like protein [Cricetulus griseus]